MRAMTPSPAVIRSTTESVWVDVGVPSKNVWGVPSLCPLPRLSPDFEGPLAGDDRSAPSSPVIVPRQSNAPSPCIPGGKTELHRVLNAIQSSTDFGIYICEDLRDPRRAHIDDYWSEVADRALGLDELHRAVGPVATPLTDEARAQMHQLARLLERLSKRIDRVVLAS